MKKEQTMGSEQFEEDLSDLKADIGSKLRDSWKEIGAENIRMTPFFNTLFIEQIKHSVLMQFYPALFSDGMAGQIGLKTEQPIEDILRNNTAMNHTLDIPIDTGLNENTLLPMPQPIATYDPPIDSMDKLKTLPSLKRKKCDNTSIDSNDSNENPKTQPLTKKKKIEGKIEGDEIPGKRMTRLQSKLMATLESPPSVHHAEVSDPPKAFDQFEMDHPKAESMVNSTVLMAPNEPKTQLPPEMNTEPSGSQKFQCHFCKKNCSNDMDLKAHRSLHWPSTSDSGDA